MRGKRAREQARGGWLDDLTFRAISVSTFIALFAEFYWNHAADQVPDHAGDEADAIVIATA